MNHNDSTATEKLRYMGGRVRYIILHPNFQIIPTAQKMEFSINDFFSKCDQIRRKLRI